MTLVEAEKGTKVRVVRRGIGRGIQAHLDGIGIHIGDELVVLGSAPFHGPVLVEVVRTGVRVALGHGMAERIEVSPLDGSSVDAAVSRQGAHRHGWGRHH